MNTQKAQHTPGPWHANGTQIIGKSGRRLQYVAEVLRDNGVIPARANAQLIAESPAMCEALSRVAVAVQAVTERISYPYGYDALRADLQAIERDARAAIAKATGEEGK